MSDAQPKKKILGMPVWAFVLVLTLGLAVVAIPVILAAVVVVLVPTIQEQARVTQSKSNLHALASMMVERHAEKGDWPKQDGKAFVLSLVAEGRLDASQIESRRLLFSPADPEYQAEDIERQRYVDLAKSGLADRDVHDMTSYVGRRNATKGFELPPDAGGDEPILADVSPVDVVIIAFADGSVRKYDHEDLGLDGPYMPGELPVGDGAPHPLLRKLSR